MVNSLLLGGGLLSALLSAVSAAPTAVEDIAAPITTPSFLHSIGLYDPETDGGFNNETGPLAARDGVIGPRDLRNPMPDRAHWREHRFQPVLDFDKDGCYYTAAIDSSGNLNPGLGAHHGVPPNCLRAECRDNNRLELNNMYSRMRCNNGWCAIMYEYYFEKDQTVCGGYSSGHRHDWEHVIVFVQGDRVHRVAPSCHNGYGGATNSPRIHDGTRAKIVYHKDGGSTHCLRMASAADDNIENYTGQWFIGRLIGYNNWADNWVRDRMIQFHGGGIRPKFDPGSFTDHLRRAAGNDVQGFNPEWDDNSYA